MTKREADTHTWARGPGDMRGRWFYVCTKCRASVRYVNMVRYTCAEVQVRNARDSRPEVPVRKDQLPPTGDDTLVTPIARRMFNVMLTEGNNRGILRYGTGLRINNGRNAIKDAMEEAIDLWQYLAQIHLEHQDMQRRLALAEARADDAEARLAGWRALATGGVFDVQAEPRTASTGPDNPAVAVDEVD